MSKLNSMHINDWLEEDKGRSTALAAHFGVTRSAISQWKTNGVPVEFMLRVRDYTRGAVSLEEMVAKSAARRAAKESTPQSGD